MIKRKNSKEPTMVERDDKRGLSTIVATLIIILLVLVAVGILWVVIRNVIQSGAEQISLGKFTLNLEIKGAIIDPAIPNYIIVRLKRNPGEGQISGLKFILEDRDTTEVVEVNNYSMKQLEERTFNLSLIEISNSSNIIKISVAPIFKLESGKEVTGDVKDEYDVPKTSVSGGTPCIPNCAGKQCGSNGCGGSCGPCTSPATCNSTGQCVTATMVWTNELMTNPGFEWNNLTGWTTSNAGWRTGADAPEGNTSAQAGSWCAFFSTYASNSSQYIYQDVDVTAYAGYIDAGDAVVNASGWGISTNFHIDPGYWDRSRIQILFLFSNGTIIATPYDSGYVNQQPWWQGAITNYPIPQNTRYIRMWGNTYETLYPSGNLDSFSVRIGYFS